MPAKRNSQPSTAKLSRLSRKARQSPEQGAGRPLEVPKLRFGAEICSDLSAAEQREWLVTNGIGGFASGTVAGSSTRRYHGLLLAALAPPVGRTQFVGGLDEVVKVDGTSYALATHRWLSGAVAPQGHLLLSEFYFDGLIPVWVYQTGGAHIEKRIWMQQGSNTTYVHYTVTKSDVPVALELKALVNYRDFHSATHAGDWRMRIDPVENGVRVDAFEGAVPYYLKSANATCQPQHNWYRDFFYSRERDRGLEDHEDQLMAAEFQATIENGQSATVVLSTEENVLLDGAVALEAEKNRQANVLDSANAQLSASGGMSAPSWLPQLWLAADQFLATRPLPDQPDGKTLLAGFHWFGDWGRDTMIALPGIVLSTGRADVARQILIAFSRFVDRGMLPNNFPDSGSATQYNTIDATLWYFEAIRQYYAATNDLQALRFLFPVLEKIIEAHLDGTRYNIHVDPADGLLYGGGPGVQLTWMDAKIGDWVVTPRTGKPVEINALWLNALVSMKEFATQLGRPADVYDSLAARVESNFNKFWNAERNCCFDVIDAPGFSVDSGETPANDAALRPNQIFAVSLPKSPLTPEQQKAVVDVCAGQLLTPFGLRSLAPGQRGYAGAYAGGPRERDAVYHQGTVWGWLLGPFALAHYRVYRDRASALALLEPLARATDSYGLGTLAEVYDGDSPHRPGGCIAQAWTVAETLRAWMELSRA